MNPAYKNQYQIRYQNRNNIIFIVVAPLQAISVSYKAFKTNGYLIEKINNYIVNTFTYIYLQRNIYTFCFVSNPQQW